MIAKGPPSQTIDMLQTGFESIQILSYSYNLYITTPLGTIFYYHGYQSNLHYPEYPEKYLEV